MRIGGKKSVQSSKSRKKRLVKENIAYLHAIRDQGLPSARGPCEATPAGSNGGRGQKENYLGQTWNIDKYRKGRSLNRSRLRQSLLAKCKGQRGQVDLPSVFSEGIELGPTENQRKRMESVVFRKDDSIASPGKSMERWREAARPEKRENLRTAWIVNHAEYCCNLQDGSFPHVHGERIREWTTDAIRNRLEKGENGNLQGPVKVCQQAHYRGRPLVVPSHRSLREKGGGSQRDSQGGLVEQLDEKPSDDKGTRPKKE